MRKLLCDNSQFVGKLCEDKSLAPRARDLIFFKTDLQAVNYYTTIEGATATRCFSPLLGKIELASFSCIKTISAPY